MQLEILSGFNIVKQGDTKSVFKFKILDFEKQPVDITGKTVSVIIANSSGKILEKTPNIDDAETGVISFNFEDTDVTGHGDMRLEVHVTDADGTAQIIPSSGYYRFDIIRNLNDMPGGVTNYSLKYFTDNFNAKMSAFDTKMSEVAGAVESANTATESAYTAATSADNKATELEQRVDDAIAAGTVDLEVKDARKGEPHLNARLNKFDSSLAQTQQQKADKTAVVSLETRMNDVIQSSDLDPNKDIELVDARNGESTLGTRLNKMNRELDEFAEISLVNMLSNGSFENGITGWITPGAITAVAYQGLIGDYAAYATPSVSTYLEQPYTASVNDEIYVRCWVKLVEAGSGGNVVELRVRNKEGTVSYASDNLTNQVLNEWIPLSASGRTLVSSGNIRCTLRTVGGITPKLYIDGFMAINLTKVFGAGNEPTKEEMDALLGQFPNTWFDNEAKIGTKIDKHILTKIRDVQQASKTLYDADADANLIYSLDKEEGELKLKFETQTKELKADSVVHEGVTLSSLFNDKNVIKNSHFDNDLTGFPISAGTPTISTTVYNTPSKSMQITGTTSQQALIPFTAEVGRKFYVAAKVKVTRYVSGGGLGFAFMSTDNNSNRTLTNVSDDFVTISSIHTVNTTNPRLYVGSVTSANADGFIDDIVAVDITDFTVTPSVTEMNRYYEAYLKTLKGEKTSGTVTTTYKFVTEKLTTIADEDVKTDFINAMNKKAQEIGMVNTTFVNPHGLHSATQLTTAKDIMLMGIHAVGYDYIVKTWNKKSYTFKVHGANAREITVNTSVASPSLDNYYYVFGGKTGTANNINNLLVLVNAPNGNWFVGAILDADSNRFSAAKEAFDIATLYLDDNYTPPAEGHTVSADNVAVCLMPNHHPFAYEHYDVPMLFSKNETVAEVPASITKVLTSMLLLDYITDLNQEIQLKASDITSGSGPIFYEGDRITLKDALFSLLLPSSNTCASAIARVVGYKILENKR